MPGKTFEIIFKEFSDSNTFVMSRGLLEDYKRQAAHAERERIIKLLEPYLDCGGCDGYHCTCDRSGFFIELIKGEN